MKCSKRGCKRVVVLKKKKQTGPEDVGAHGYPVTIEVRATARFGRTIARVEIYVDGSLVASVRTNSSGICCVSFVYFFFIFFKH